MIVKEWWTAAELAAEGLPDVPTTEQGVRRLIEAEGWREQLDAAGAPMARRRAGKGGGWEYRHGCLPQRAQIALAKRAQAARAAVPPATPQGSGADWDWYRTLPETRRAKAEARLAALEAVEALVIGGLAVDDATHQVAMHQKVSAAAIYSWKRLVAGLSRADWLPALAPRYVGRTGKAVCDPRVWELLKADYLRLEAPSFETCWRRAKATAEQNGWAIAAQRTLYRRIETEIPRAVVTLARQGMGALERMYPPQERDRSQFRALEAVNVDGHKWDVFVRWPDGTIGRPMMVAIQDLYSNKILSWRIDRTENADSVRLAFKDLFERHGIPDLCWMDNGRGFASKWITGGSPTRYRFKVKAEEPAGILTALGVKVHWTRPYSGQSKPIERAFRDLCDAVAKHPAFAGAYTGNSPDAKPENYGSKAVPIDDFVAVVGQGIVEHNARPRRRTKVCGGVLSFDEAYERSLASLALPPRKAGPEQLAMCLMAAEAVRADRESGSLRLLGNRYWGEFLHRHLGELLTVRFDPDALHDGVEVYCLDGRHVGRAECVEAVGFADVAAARAHAARRNAFVKATRQAAELERRLSLDELVRLLPEVAEPDVPDVPVVRLVRGANALKPRPETEIAEDEFDRLLSAGLRLVESSRGDGI